MSDRSGAARSGNRIEELDGLRAVCVLAVILAHETGAGRVPVPEAWKALLENWGELAVQCFFGISGFIITRLLLEEQRREGHIGLRAFYIRRVFRIIPAYWTYLLAVFVLTAAGWITVLPKCFLGALAMVTDYPFFTNLQGWFVGHSWSLSLEEQYYVVFPFVLWVVLGGRRRPMFMFLGILYVLVCYVDKVRKLFVHLDLSNFTNFKYIIAGVLMALLWERIGFLFRRVTVLVPLALAAILAVRVTYLPASFWAKLLVTPLEGFAMAYLLGWCALNPEPCFPLRWRVVQWVGRCSYSLYLWQQLFTGQDFYYHKVKLATLPWSLAGLFLCAAISYHFIERPCLRLGHRLSKRLNPATLSQREETAAIVSA